MKKDIESFFEDASKWQKEFKIFRQLLLDCGLNEELKWGQPCYTYKKGNIAILYGFKDFCGPGFFKGVLLKDEKEILEKPGENSQSSRYIKFTDTQQIIEMEAVLRAYIFEAIEVEKAGLKVDFKEKNELKFPEELQQKFQDNPIFKKAFEKLTPGRQREYNLYFTAAKQAKTRTSRIESYMQRILDGYGKSDCLCGHSKRMPRCDGSHKHYS